MKKTDTKHKTPRNFELIYMKAAHAENSYKNTFWNYLSILNSKERF